jgi:hypothetical protein
MALPCISTFTFPVLGILLKWTMFRQHQDVWLSSWGQAVLSQLTSQPICPVTFHCLSQVPSCHALSWRTGERPREGTPGHTLYTSHPILLP